MKNKIIILVVFAVILIVLVGFYFLKQDKSISDLPKNIKDDAEKNNQTENEQLQKKLVTDDFEITLPVGWEQTTPAIGTSAMAVNENEKLDDPAAQKINFKSYFAISYDTLQKKSLSEYLQNIKNTLLQTISNVVFTNEQDIIIDIKPARAVEAELTQQGVDFKILMVVIAGQQEDVWVISFNTTKSSWDGYKEIFSNITKSFSLKK